MCAHLLFGNTGSNVAPCVNITADPSSKVFCCISEYISRLRINSESDMGEKSRDLPESESTAALIMTNRYNCCSVMIM